ncbi:MAG: translesion error-prone DNA polymerase V autoproteolytic subunit [Muribaculaceae bacterium]
MNDNTIKELDVTGECRLPMLESVIPAGFPSPAQGLPSDAIDLNRELIHHPSSTFCARVAGNSMMDCGISDGDLLIIDKSLVPHNGAVAVCFVDGEFTLKKIAIRTDGIYLVPANEAYSEIRVSEDSNFQVWGIVTYIIKSVK